MCILFNSFHHNNIRQCGKTEVHVEEYLHPLLLFMKSRRNIISLCCMSTGGREENEVSQRVIVHAGLANIYKGIGEDAEESKRG